jgi:hydrogenase nickel incorporation protein HypA/HybF
MHELAVTESILKTSLEYAEKEQAKKVTDVFLVIGKLSSYVDDSIQFYWDYVSKDTICCKSLLHFDRIPAKMLCLDCQTEFVLTDDLSPCPKCGSARLRILTGDEFRIDSIQIEK